MARPARISPDRLLDVAALEFAERGFAGARVDRIARRARVNKAMLYYHFKSKERLYRTLLRRMFAGVASRIEAVAAGPEPPAEKIERAIAAFAEAVEQHPPLSKIMLREVAEGGARLDRETLRTLAAVPAAFARIVRDGVEAGAFRDVHPAFAYFSAIAPIVFYLAGAPIRREIAQLRVVDLGALSTARFVEQAQSAMRHALAHESQPAR